jgi:acyl-coenzyme A thioesterase PaaI-like protein
MTDLRKLKHPDSYRAILDATIDPPPQAASAVVLADALRQLVRTTVGSSASDDVLEEVAETVRGLVDRLTPFTAPTRAEQGARFGPAGMFVNHPIIGPANPSAPPVRLVIDENTLTADVVFGTAQEGPPDCAHGGWIAAGFDAVLLMAAGLHSAGGPTKSLSVRYRRPTPLNQPLRYETSIETIEERRTVIHGRLMHGDVVCAEGVAEVARLRPAEG